MFAHQTPTPSNLEYDVQTIKTYAYKPLKKPTKYFIIKTVEIYQNNRISKVPVWDIVTQKTIEERIRRKT